MKELAITFVIIFINDNEFYYVLNLLYYISTF